MQEQGQGQEEVLANGNYATPPCYSLTPAVALNPHANTPILSALVVRHEDNLKLFTGVRP